MQHADLRHAKQQQQQQQQHHNPWRDYQKIKVVGRGAHGVAILCRRRRDSSLVVVKEVYQEDLPADDRQLSDSMNEIRLLSMLRHDNILAYYDSFRALASAESVATGGDQEDEEVARGVERDAERAQTPLRNNEKEPEVIMIQNRRIAATHNAEKYMLDGKTPKNQLELSSPSSALISELKTSAAGEGIQPGIFPPDTSESAKLRVAESGLAGDDDQNRRKSRTEKEQMEGRELALMIVMEYADGGTLHDYLQHQASTGTLLEEREVLNLFCQISLALHHVHACNILHRDLKTTNILISGTGPNKVLKIGDFGISKQLGSKSKADTVVGTPSYISPELCEGKPYDHKSDVWALGCILYEIAMLKRLFEASNLLALVLKIMRGNYEPLSSKYSRELDALLRSLINLNPSQRPDMTAVISVPFLQGHIIDTQLSMGRVNPTFPPPAAFPTAQTDGRRKSSVEIMESGGLDRKLGILG